jgi:hypothetical protein
MVDSNKYRVKEERLVIHPIIRAGADELISLKSSGKIEILNQKHEEAAAWVYVAFANICDHWVRNEVLGNGALIPDRTLWYRGYRFYIEIDMGNMNQEQIESKIKGYRKHAGPGKVIFVLKDGKYPMETVGGWIMSFAPYNRLGNFCTFATHENITMNPRGKVIASVKDGMISIDDLCSVSL